MKERDMNLIDEISQAEYLQEICKATPQITIGTQCGIGMYQFKSIGYRDSELVLEFKLIMDNKRTDSDKIAYNIGERCVLTAAQFLYAFEYNAYA